MQLRYRFIPHLVAIMSHPKGAQLHNAGSSKRYVIIYLRYFILVISDTLFVALSYTCMYDDKPINPAGLREKPRM
jgi:hypothetical protein